MSDITFACGTSHAPILTLPPKYWDRSKTGDMRPVDTVHYDGAVYAYAELLKLRGSDMLTYGNSPESRRRHFNRIQECIAELGTRVADAALDALVIIGDDHHEFFGPAVQPPFFIYTGEEAYNPGYDPDDYEDEALAIIMSGRRTREPAYFKCAPDLATVIVAGAATDGFDVTVANTVNEGVDGPLEIGHSVAFVHRRVLNGNEVPLVPVLMNTYFPPNQPSIARCFEFGRSIGRAVQTWSGDQKVGVVASGGLTHFAVIEEFDRKVIEALRTRDIDTLLGIPEPVLQSGTSEVKNWVAALGVIWETDLLMDLIDYVPAYRSDAGTGVGAAFATWS